MIFGMNSLIVLHKLLDALFSDSWLPSALWEDISFLGVGGMRRKPKNNPISMVRQAMDPYNFSKLPSTKLA